MGKVHVGVLILFIQQMTSDRVTVHAMLFKVDPFAQVLQFLL